MPASLTEADCRAALFRENPQKKSLARGILAVLPPKEKTCPADLLKGCGNSHYAY
jgi:hypothetical protein